VEQILDKSTQEAFPDGKAYYYPGRNVSQGGVDSWRTNYFSLNCTEAEAMPAQNDDDAAWAPPRYVGRDRLVILTDGTCGSTCACFTKIPQEAGHATFVGAGGVWNEGMDVSSFAGGFVVNPSIWTQIAEWSSRSFPAFLTNQRWQMGWAVWYSKKMPSRPAQFTEQQPDERDAFWGFPHASIDPSVSTVQVSALYDRVIASSVARLAADADADCTDDDNNNNKDDDDDDRLNVATGNALIAMTVLLGVSVLGLGG